jgi:hypothetical protein
VFKNTSALTQIPKLKEIEKIKKYYLNLLFKIILGCLPFTKSFEVSSIYKTFGVTQTKCLRSSSLYKNIVSL